MMESKGIASGDILLLEMEHDCILDLLHGIKHYGSKYSIENIPSSFLLSCETDLHIRALQ